MPEVTFHVAGMTCQHCVDRVTRALTGAPGVTDAQVNLEAGTATVVLTEDAALTGAQAAVREAGYELTDDA